MEQYLQHIMDCLTENDPEASAIMKGSPMYSRLSGKVLFYPFWHGTLVYAGISGLPSASDPCGARMCAFHIHEGRTCSGTITSPFANAGEHFNPGNCSHPEHAGDLPLLLSAHGIALLLTYTDRFTPKEVIGRTVIIHEHPDDFHSQPSGNAGSMIGCGEIRALFRTAQKRTSV